MAVVSQQADLRNIQQEIADGLGLELRQETASIRASLLHKRLMDTKKVLLVLDDVWERWNLDEIGIPSQSVHKGCKIILTSRNHHVCIEMMSMKDSTKIVLLDVLDEKEALALFRQKAGSIVDEPNVCKLAIAVAKECKGLPLALVTVGSALREQTKKPVWEDALLQLQRSAPTNIPGFLKHVYQPLELSYKHLESNEARYLFLLCCLFPEDSNIEIENLVNYGIALRMFSTIETIREARNRVHHLVEMLKNRFLLMDGANRYRTSDVKMHDVIRDMAISIASSGEHIFMVSHDSSLREWPKTDFHEDYTSISLTFGSAMAIPELLNCPRLKALRVTFQGSTTKPKLPNSFFDGMEGLRLLNMCRVFPSSSLHLPTKLRTLHLHHCDFNMVDIIGELFNLEMLSLWGSQIEMLPHSFGNLTKLKMLDLTGSFNLKNIALGVVAKLVQLEELRLLFCPIEWEDEKKGNERINASLTEVFSLMNLCSLDIWILDSEMIPQDICHLHNLTSYSIIIGNMSQSFGSNETFANHNRIMVHVDKKNAWMNSMSVLFIGTQELLLSGMGSKGIIDLLTRKRFENLSELIVSSVGAVKHLANTVQQDITLGNIAIFPVLKLLVLFDMNDLEEICHGPPTVGSFSELQRMCLRYLDRLVYLWKCPSENLSLTNLKEIEIVRCGNLKWVFPLSIAESLCQLEEIDIEDCPNMEEVFKDERIIEGGVTTFNPIKFPKLNLITLWRLPRLCALSKAVDVIEFPSLRNLDIAQVPPSFKIFSHQPDPNEEVTCNGLDLRMRELDMEILHREVPIGIFNGLDKLEIEFCHSLTTMFSPRVFRGLVNLRELTVRECLILEEIVGKEEGEEKAGRNMMSKPIIPKLELLVLSNLPRIRYFCPFINALELPLLRYIYITDCPTMETFALKSCSTSILSSIPSFFLDKEVCRLFPQQLCKFHIYAFACMAFYFLVWGCESVQWQGDYGQAGDFRVFFFPLYFF